MDEQFLGLSVDEWFKYHPPETEVRKRMHSEINANAQLAARAINTEAAAKEIEEFLIYIENLVILYCSELIDWYDQLRWRFQDPRNTDLDLMMLIQSMKMLANQIVTVADLKGMLREDEEEE